jgi:hypothetical protein
VTELGGYGVFASAAASDSESAASLASIGAFFFFFRRFCNSNIERGWRFVSLDLRVCFF